MIDTVSQARRTPELVQPWAELGLRESEYHEIRQILGRRPTASELAMYSVMWSEHCSYKSSKRHLKKFSALDQSTPRGRLLAGIGEQAGVVDIGDGWAVTFKLESHNHPSYYEPYIGAATGVGGVVRDILAMGARPVAVMAPLRFGPLGAADTARVLTGAVAGLGWYAKALDLPAIGGEVVFDQSYAGNPLVNALCVGVLRHHDLQRAAASGIGNKVVLYGAPTGRHGIGGASILASETFSQDGPSERSSGLICDPALEKAMIEATLELFEAGLIQGIQDLGAAGLSCATSELASAGSGGMRVDLDAVPLAAAMSAEEILMSESQERMMAVVAPADVERFIAICGRRDVVATVVGEVIAGERLLIEWQGQLVVDVDPRTVAHLGPDYDRPIARPDWIDQVQADRVEDLPRPATAQKLAQQLLSVITAENLCDVSMVAGQLEHAGAATVMAHPDDAGMLGVDASTGLGIALSTDCNARFAYLDPYRGAQVSLAEAYLNVAVTGAEPVAITDCLNFGSPEDPEIMWQFVETIDALVEGCRELGVPVTGGNVSFYNKTGETAILPTAMIGMLGVIDDVADRVTSGFVADGDLIYLLGATADELSGSAWAEVIHTHLGGTPPEVDFAHHRRMAGFFQTASKTRLLSSAHDLSNGGLAVAVLESCFRNRTGAEITLTGDPFVALFSESTGRVLISCHPDKAPAVEALAAHCELPITALGKVRDQAELVITDQFSLDLNQVRQAWHATMPTALA